jgi:16S rRNA (cytosine967-C5)-methyltransferase
VVAIDCDETRLKRVHDNLKRLKLQAKVVCGDARTPSEWWQGEQFDRILLDAPCSATGVIRRHPDIKWLRRSDDIEALAELQREIFDAMWQQLKSGGTLVYATCSITPQENKEQVKAFLARTDNAQLIDSDIDNPGRQILPGEEDMDGFYYAVLKKA